MIIMVMAVILMNNNDNKNNSDNINNNSKNGTINYDYQHHINRRGKKLRTSKVL